MSNIFQDQVHLYFLLYKFIFQKWMWIVSTKFWILNWEFKILIVCCSMLVSNWSKLCTLKKLNHFESSIRPPNTQQNNWMRFPVFTHWMTGLILSTVNIFKFYENSIINIWIWKLSTRSKSATFIVYRYTSICW